MASMNTISPMTEDQSLHFQAWRATALQTMGYMASVMFSLRPVHCSAVDTFAVDPGHRLYINFDNCIPKGPQFCAEGLLHECSHLIAEHSMLAVTAGVTDEERKMWNVAADAAINDDLRDAGCAALAAHGVFAAHLGEPDYQTPLHYLDVLRKLKKPNSQPQGGSGGQGQGGKPTDGDQPFKGCGSGSGGEAGSFELGEDDSLGGAAEPANEVEKRLVRIATAAAIQQHQKQHGIGSVPGGFAEILDQVLAPSVTPWDRVLASFIRRAVASKAGYFDTTFTRRNRRRMNETLRTTGGRVRGRVIAPGYIKPVPSVHFYRDTSGSMRSHDLDLATNEVVAIARKLGIRGDDLVVSDIDTQVHQSQRFTGRDSITNIQGRGGTEMGEAIVHACSLRTKPSVIVIATDGETGWPQERPSVPVVVLLVNLRSEVWKERVPDWALTVEVASND
ncbi:DUF2201 family putative metallopeptidase [Arthrobacter sp. A2-55]|uniref:vWA domain-containing protein n=1 Tax=Arthrobacter sp. A2-55 TaxID=2897337 RepID=UPI0021CDAB98|nr:VWA-like domain-containing protein [Arthrobacter sp. A2-55]MCU6480131.1 VWA-like domain-containing protein [Arthrobacter sp. A2-55]